MDLEKPYWEQDQIEMARIYTDKLFYCHLGRLLEVVSNNNPR